MLLLEKAPSKQGYNYVYSRDKYKDRLDRFEEQCQFLGYLSDIMKAGYREPEERTGEFEYRMTSFLSLHDSGVTTGVIS